MRSIWNGSINFGLVSIPVKLYSASEERKLDLDMLDSRDHSRIRYKRVNENTGAEVEWKDIVTCFRREDAYIGLEDSDFDSAIEQKSESMDIEELIAEGEVNEILFKKCYCLEPQKGGEKSYTLLRDALKKTGNLGVATFVLRQKENLSLIGVYQDVIVLHSIRFADEIRNPEELKIPSVKVSKKETDMALALIEIGRASCRERV